MNIKGSPTSIELFGFQGVSGNSPDLFENKQGSPDKHQQYTTPSKKRPCFRSPKFSSGNRNELISPLSAAISNSVQGVYCTQEIKEQDSNFQGDVWKILKALRDKTDVLLSYNIKNILQGRNLYRGKVAHISAIVKSVEAVSQKDTSIVLYDNTGEIKAAVHSKVMEKYGSLLEPGVGLLLRQCTVFSFITVQKYVNITLPNIVHVYNSSSLHPDTTLIDKHILEVSEINVQKIENPDTENQTPNITLNTPNRPPPPRPYRNNSRASTPQNNPRANTPQNNPRANTMQNNPRANSFQNKHSPYNTPTSMKNATCANQTPQKTWTPQRNRFQQQSTTQPQQAGAQAWSNRQTPQKTNHMTTPIRNSRLDTAGDVASKKRNSGEGEGSSKRIRTTPPQAQCSVNLKTTPPQAQSSVNLKTTPPQAQCSVKNNNISPKEQEEIAKLLEDIDDSFFDEF